MENQTVVFVLIKAHDGIFIMADDKFSITAFTSEKKALAHFEDSYNINHVRGYEASMSACINFIQFQPKIVTASFEVVKNEIAAKEPHGFVLIEISGTMYGISTRDGALKFWENGKTPKLIGHEKVQKLYEEKVLNESNI